MHLRKTAPGQAVEEAVECMWAFSCSSTGSSPHTSLACIAADNILRWMAGGAIASDSAGRLFVSTGNAEGGEVNQQSPASGRLHLDTLSEAIVNLAVDSQTGLLSQEDYFEPSTYLAMDAGDRDLGAGGVCLPDPSTFSGGGVNRLAIACGKNGLCFVTNADNLGGFKMGSAGGDAIVQMITPPGKCHFPPFHLAVPR